MEMEVWELIVHPKIRKEFTEKEPGNGFIDLWLEKCHLNFCPTGIEN